MAPSNPNTSARQRNREQQPLIGILPFHQHTASDSPNNPEPTLYRTIKKRTAHFLTTKWAHYTILSLVSLDVLSVLASFLLSISTCEGRIDQETSHKLATALGILSLVFSSIFVLELCTSIWAFGLDYFRSKFHVFDSCVIVVGFAIDVALEGLVEEVGSLVIALRLWRVFKIIQGLTSGAEQQMARLQERIDGLEEENEKLQDEVERLRKGGGRRF